MEVEGFRDGAMDPLHVGATSDHGRGHLQALIGSEVGHDLSCLGKVRSCD